MAGCARPDPWRRAKRRCLDLGTVRIFVAGATGVIGARLVPLLVADGHEVAGMTRSAGKTGLLADLGAEPVVCDVFDADALTHAVVSFAPDVVFHQLTDLPDSVTNLAAYGHRNDRMRSEGTRNLLAAAAAARAGRVIAQSISWELPSASRRAVTAVHERAVVQAGGVVIRYGKLYGPGSYYPGDPPGPPRIHVDDAARQTLPALAAPAGVTIVVDDRAVGSVPDGRTGATGRSVRLAGGLLPDRHVPLALRIACLGVARAGLASCPRPRA